MSASTGFACAAGVGGSGGNRDRKVKSASAEQYELAGFPASAAGYKVSTAGMLIRAHVRRYGATVLLTDALVWLDKAQVSIEEWRQADMARCGYPYQRKPGRA